jgi:diguanylate cyclase (GGDEF)-like protein
VAVRRRNLLLAFGLCAALPFAVTGLVLALDSGTFTTIAALATLYVCLFPIVALASTGLHRHAVEHERLANYDPLTGLPNRALFTRKLRAALAGKTCASVMVADVDLFKKLNDRYGHLNGDEALRDVAERLTVAVRATDTVARLGGDEFGMILPGAGPEVAAQVARRIVSAFEAPFVLDGTAMQVAVSLGVAVFPKHGDDPDTLVEAADFAMYAAKDGGGATFRIAESTADTSKGPGQAIGALRPVRRAAPAKGG